jgi:acetoacetyl-CoA synthetase
VPRTLSGKKMEVPVKKLFLGLSVEKSVSLDAMANPESIQFFNDFAEKAGFRKPGQ